MAQHDYNLANQSGADFRADLNNALSAIVTVNSGATAPSTTFSHQLWVDTSSNVLKIRNAANDAWVTTGVSITADNTFAGNLTGNVTGNLTGDVTGNADTATALETARTINGASFDGTANISFDTDSVSEGSSNLYFTNARVESYLDAGTATPTFASAVINTSITGTAILDDDTFGTASATTVSTSESIKAYVDSQVGTVDTLSEILANGNTTGGTDIAFGDNDKAIFGTGSDLEIYHSGTHSIIADVGTGDLLLRGNNARLQNSDGSATFIHGFNGGEVQVNYAGNTKLATTSSGIDVTGTVTADGLTVDGNPHISVGDTNTQYIQFGSTEIDNRIGVVAYDNIYIEADRNNANPNSSIVHKIDNKNRLLIKDTGDISFYDDTGTSQNLKWDASADTLNFVDNAKATFGASNDLQIYHDGSNSYIKNSGTGNLYIQDTDYSGDVYIQAQPNENSIIAYNNSSVVLFYDNAQKLTTQSTGIDVTGTVKSDGLEARKDTGSTTNSLLKLTNSAGSTTDGAGITFEVANTSGAGGSVNVVRDGSNFKPYMTLNTSANISTAPSQRVRIDDTGIDVTGTVKSDGLTVDGTTTLSGATLSGDLLVQKAAATITVKDSNDGGTVAYVFSNNSGNTSSIRGASSSQDIQIKPNEVLSALFESGGDISFYDDTGTSQNLKWDASADTLNFVDNAKATFGAGNDLQIYHNGSNSYIKDGGTGELLVQSNLVAIQNAAGSENMAKFIQDGAVQLYYDDSKKLATTSSGIDVTGTVTSDGLTVGSGNITASGNEGVVKIATVNSGSGTLWTDINTGDNAYSSMPSEVAIINSADNTANSFAGVFFQAGEDSSGLAISSARIGAIRTGSATTDLSFATRGVGGMRDRLRVFSGGDISFYDDTGSTQGLFWDASAERLGIGETNLDAKLHLTTAIAGLINQKFESAGSAAWRIGIPASQTYFAFDNANDNLSSPKVVIDSSGNLLVGKTNTTLGTVGIENRADGRITSIRSGNTNLVLNRLTSDGSLIDFYKDGSTVGSIGVASNDLNINGGANHSGIRFQATGLYPLYNGVSANGTIDLGATGQRFQSLHLSDTAFIGTSSNTSGNRFVHIDGDANGVTTGYKVRTGVDGTGTSYHNAFVNPNGIVGTISTNGSATAYNTSSDARLKDVTGEARGLEVITKLNPVAYNWKADGKADEGLIAQEVKELVPNAVTGSEDEHYQMDYSKLVTHLVKGMKEQQEQIEFLKEEIANLKGE